MSYMVDEEITGQAIFFVHSEYLTTGISTVSRLFRIIHNFADTPYLETCCVHWEIKIARRRILWVYHLNVSRQNLAERYLNGVSFSCAQGISSVLVVLPLSSA